MLVLYLYSTTSPRTSNDQAVLHCNTLSDCPALQYNQLYLNNQLHLNVCSGSMRQCHPHPPTHPPSTLTPAPAHPPAHPPTILFETSRAMSTAAASWSKPWIRSLRLAPSTHLRSAAKQGQQAQQGTRIRLVRSLQELPLTGLLRIAFLAAPYRLPPGEGCGVEGEEVGIGAPALAPSFSVTPSSAKACRPLAHSWPRLPRHCCCHPASPRAARRAPSQIALERQHPH